MQSHRSFPRFSQVRVSEKFKEMGVMKRLALVILVLVAVLAALGPGRPPLGSAALPPAITGGGHHSCALLGDGTAKCWGYNGHGQLGDGTTTERHTPGVVSGLTNAVAISAGSSHTCALLSDGTVRCWGHNGFGELGDGTTTDRYTPVVVSGLTNAVAIGVGDIHSCALLSDGTARCWGHNSVGQLGDGTTTDRITPAVVSGLSDAVAIAVGDYHTCALLSDGTARCWGDNGYGQLGDGTMTNRQTPVDVSGLTNAVDIAAGTDHTCALLSDGTAKCWGDNRYGQLGDGTTTNRMTPMAVSGLSNAVAIAPGNYHTCALLNDGTAGCWGNNGKGQLGDGTTTYHYTPVAVSGLSDAVAIGAGWYHTCALLSDGTAKCWGNNGHGQLGDGTTTNRTTPVDVLDFPTCIPPANDDFANSAGIGAVPFAASLSTMCTTSQVNEPQSCASIGSTVWYSYTPSESETIQVGTIGSGYDTALAVYTGSYLGNLSSVACDDDSGPGLTSLATFAATAGTTYHFQLGGFGGSKGDLRFELVAPTPTPTPVDTATPTITPTPCPPNACTPTPTPSPSPTGAWPAPKVSIDETVNGDQGPITVNIGDSVTFRWVVSNTGTQMVTAQIVNDPQHGLDSTCSQLWPGGNCENSLQGTLSTSGPVVNTSHVSACDMKGNCTSAEDYVKVNVVDPLATSVPPIGGIAEYPQLQSDAVASTHDSPRTNEFALAGLATGSALLLAAGGWCAKRRWLR